MAGCSQRPRCHKTKKRRCILPNPWLSYLAHNGGKGLSRDEIMHGYKVWKSATFRRFTSSSKAHVARRQGKLCDIFAPKSRPAPRKVSRAAPPRRQPKAAAPNQREKLKKAQEKRRVEREKEQAAAAKERARDEAAARRAAAKKKREQSAARERYSAPVTRRAAASKTRKQQAAASEERKKKREQSAASAPVTRRAAASKAAASEERKKKREQSAASAPVTRRSKAAASEERKKKASDERRRTLKGKGKAKPTQRMKRPTASQRNEVNALRERFCKDSFKSPVLGMIDQPSSMPEKLYGVLSSEIPRNPLKAYRLNTPKDHTCLWTSIAAGLLGSTGQWNMIKRDGESLCDRLMTLLQQYRSEAPRRAFDIRFLKWIALKQLRETPVINRKCILTSYNSQGSRVGEESNYKVKVRNQYEVSPTEKDYDKIEEHYTKELMKNRYWGGDAEMNLLSEALSPLVGLAVFAPPENSDPTPPMTRRSRKRKVEQPAPDIGLSLQRWVHPDKPASVLLLRYTGHFHYELLSLQDQKKNFLVLGGRVPHYMVGTKT